VLSWYTEREAASENKAEEDGQASAKKPKTTTIKKTVAKKSTPAKKKLNSVPTPSLSNLDDEDEEDLSMPDLSSEEGGKVAPADRIAVNGVVPARQSRRASRKSYAEVDGGTDEE
jgi:UV DNA damage endonuclease